MKREIRKIVRFTPTEWRTVCKRAEALKMRKGTFLRNISMCREWKIFDRKRIAYPMRMLGNVGGALEQIISVAEKSDSVYLDRLKNLRERYHACRLKLMRYYSHIINTK